MPLAKSKNKIKAMEKNASRGYFLPPPPKLASFGGTGAELKASTPLGGRGEEPENEALLEFLAKMGFVGEVSNFFPPLFLFLFLFFGMEPFPITPELSSRGRFQGCPRWEADRRRKTRGGGGRGRGRGRER